jgi:replicative DNA helicase
MAKVPNLSALRIPPHHLESEQAVLGALMLRPAAIHEITDMLTAEMFYAKKHSAIYKTILDLSMKGEPIDVLSIAAKMKERKTITDIGGASYLNELMSNVPSTVNIRHYAEIVYKKFILRSLIDASEQIASLAY